MLSDEEKKAIEFVKSELQDEKIARNDYQSLTGLYGNLEIETVLNIIEKQSKEIEELKEDNKKKSIVIIEYQDLYEKLEDKIKAKIEDILNSENSEAIEKLIEWQSLLEKE